MNTDIPSGSVVGGVPARVIGSFSDLHETRMEWTAHYKGLRIGELQEQLWKNEKNRLK